MSITRRSFVEWAASIAALAASARVRSDLAAATLDDRGAGFRPELLPSQQAVWDQQVWMAGLGPKYTGNTAHTRFVDFLAAEFKAAGCEIARDSYRLPRWDARRWEITVTPAAGQPFKAPVTSYFPYSGQTPAAGVTGALALPTGCSPEKHWSRPTAPRPAGRPRSRPPASELILHPAPRIRRWHAGSPTRILNSQFQILNCGRYSVNRYFSSTHNATTPSRQVIFLPSS